MDIKAPVSLSNTRSPKADVQTDDAVNQGESSDFDRHLSQHIEQSESEKNQLESNKIEGNQSIKEGAESPEYAEIDPDHDLVRIQPVLDGVIQMNDEVVTEALPLSTEVGVSEPLLAAQSEEQWMPLAGNVLPPEIQPGNRPENKPVVQINNQNTAQLPQGTHKLATHEPSVLLDDAVDVNKDMQKAFVAGFKAEVKVQQGPNNQQVQARPGLDIATLAAVASSQQHVPQATAGAAVNLHSATAVESFTNPFSSSSSISASVQSPSWSQGLTERVSWMMQGNLQMAELKLNPAHLGPLEVKLSIQDDKASIVFVATHAQVKEAIDAAMPRLREMLEQQGLNLEDVDVSQHSDTKEEQADASEQNENLDGASTLDAEQQVTASVMNESLINIDVNKGLSVFV